MNAPRGQFRAQVAANVPLCRDHFRLVVMLDAFPSTNPGQFVQIACRDLSTDYSDPAEFEWTPGNRPRFSAVELTSPQALLRRPFSLAARRDGPTGVELDVIHRVVGVGTDWLSKLQSGDSVFVLGPLGNKFELPPSDGIALLVGGGVGIPPMIYLADKLAGRPAVAFAGAVTRDLLPLTFPGDLSADDLQANGFEPKLNVTEFSRYAIPTVIATDDGSRGFRGYVTQALENYLDKTEIANPVIYTCGPEPMMRRIADIAIARNIPCQIAVERAMACGMGTCQSCCIKVRKTDPTLAPMPGRNWAYRLACTDGPVFRATDLLW